MHYEKFKKKIEKKTKYMTNPIYRYQGNATEWELRSGAVHRLIKAYGEDICDVNNRDRLMDLVDRYHKEVFLKPMEEMEEYKSISECEKLAVMQHLSGATGFLDFTQNAQIALWFVNKDDNKELDCPGKLYIFDIGNKTISRDVKKIISEQEELSSRGISGKKIEAPIESSDGAKDSSQAEKVISGESHYLESESSLAFKRADKPGLYYKPEPTLTRIKRQKSVFLIWYPFMSYKKMECEEVSVELKREIKNGLELYVDGDADGKGSGQLLSEDYLFLDPIRLAATSNTRKHKICEDMKKKIGLSYIGKK